MWQWMMSEEGGIPDLEQGEVDSGLLSFPLLPPQKELCRTTCLNVGNLDVHKPHVCWRTECHRYEKLTGESNTEGAHPSDVLVISGWLRGELNAEQCVAKSLKLSKNSSSNFLKQNPWCRGQAAYLFLFFHHIGQKGLDRDALVGWSSGDSQVTQRLRILC